MSRSAICRSFVDSLWANGDDTRSINPRLQIPASCFGAGMWMSWDYSDTSQLTIHGTPKRSTSMPKRAAQNVFSSGIRTLPPSPSA